MIRDIRHRTTTDRVSLRTVSRTMGLKLIRSPTNLPGTCRWIKTCQPNSHDSWCSSASLTKPAMGFARHLFTYLSCSPGMQCYPFALLFVSMVIAAKTSLYVSGVDRAVGGGGWHSNDETPWVTKPRNCSPKYSLTCAPNSDGSLFDYLHQISHEVQNINVFNTLQ